jgi:hypothetical protein
MLAIPNAAGFDLHDLVLGSMSHIFDLVLGGEESRSRIGKVGSFRPEGTIRGGPELGTRRLMPWNLS